MIVRHRAHCCFSSIPASVTPSFFSVVYSRLFATEVSTQEEPRTAQRVENKTNLEDIQFRRLVLFPPKKEFTPMRQTIDRSSMEVTSDRATRMPTDIDWTAVWPAASTFKASVVPLPVRMGFYKTKKNTTWRPFCYLPPVKRGNLELMKIPNFLHLTPPAIKKHCDALKKFCTEWPKELDTSAACAKHFPVKITCSDYCHAGLNIRDPRARIVTLRIKLSTLKFDEREKAKFIRLIERHRYDPATDEFILMVDRCPARHQNKEYAYYLLSVLVHEAKNKADWEDLITDADRDQDRRAFSRSKSKQSVLFLVRRLKSAYDAAIASGASGPQLAQRFPDYVSKLSAEATDEEILGLPLLQQFQHLWETISNLGGHKQETEDLVLQYAQLTRHMLAVPRLPGT